MTSSLVLVVFLSWLSATECGHGSHQAIVSFNARGIAGNITFTEEQGGVRIQTTLRGLRQSTNDGHGHVHKRDTHGHDHGQGSTDGYIWHVHNLPVDQTLDPAVQCLSEWVGPHYDPFNAGSRAGNYSAMCTKQTPELCEAGDLAGKFGALTPNNDLSVLDTTGDLTLSGRYSIIGRSVVVHSNVDGTNFECGTIQLLYHSGDPVTLLQATFTSPLAGVIYFKQIGTEGVAVWGKLYWVNNSERTENHTWSITQLAPGEEYRNGTCNNVGGRYNPQSNAVNQALCGPNNATFCEAGDLSRKLGLLTVAATPGQPQYAADAFFFTDSNLNLNGVRNRSISIGQDNTIIACAPLIEVETITLQQPVDGYLTVSQQGPYEDTVVTTTTLPSTSISVLNSAFNPIENCPENGAVFDPYSITHLVGENTPDKYPLGDWKNRYGDQLSNGRSIRLFDVPVYGAQTSISSLSTRYVTGDTRTCVAMIPMLRGQNVLLAKATFMGSASRDSDFNGAVYFVQRDFEYGQLGSTHIIADIQFASQRATSGHNWYVTNQGCASEIFNPFQVSTVSGSPSNYTNDCSPQYPLRCQAGDLSGKHGQLQISSDVGNRATYTFVDPNLQLSGASSIIGRSVGLSGTSGLAGCAQIRRVYVSSRPVFLRTGVGSGLRTSIARQLADGTDADFSDVLVLRQEVFSIGFGFKCLNVTVRVLGTTTEAADSNAEQVAQNAQQFMCDGAMSSVPPLSVLALTLCVLLMVSLTL